MSKPPAAVVAELDDADDETLQATIEFCETQLADDEADEPEEEREPPEAWQGDEEEWADAVEDVDAPARATVTTKEISGNDYLYYQWSESGKTKSEYIAPVNPKR